MSVIHWDKSVVSLHLREILEDYQKGDTTALLGLGVVLLGSVVVPATIKLGKPLLKSVIKSSLSLSPPTKISPTLPPPRLIHIEDN